MIKANLKILLITLLSLTALATLAPKSMAADLLDDTCSNPKAANSPVCRANNDGKNDTTSNNVVIRTIRTASNIVAVLTGLVAVAMIMIGGLGYITSGGNSEKVNTAKNRILYSILGLMVVVLSWTIIRFITDRILS